METESDVDGAGSSLRLSGRRTDRAKCGRRRNTQLRKRTLLGERNGADTPLIPVLLVGAKVPKP